MENAQIAEVFDEIADLLDLQDANQFRIRSYRTAAQTIRGLSQRLEGMVEDGEDLTKLPHIGDSTADKIHEILETGTCERLEKLRDEVPSTLTELMQVPGLGPRKTELLYKELGVETLEDLKQACEDHRVRELEGMGAKTEQNILEGIQLLETTSGRILLAEASHQVDALARFLDTVAGLERWEVAGSFRRRKETIGDLDILLLASDRGQVGDELLEYPPIEEVLSKGEERISVRLRSGLQIDFRFFDREYFGAGLLYFTGSKAHNIALREIAQDRDWKLNEYGVFKGETRLAARTEEAIYDKLGLDWMPPELREDRGEVQAAHDGNLPQLIELEDIRGDLQAHTDETDGDNTLEEMAEAARGRGYEYLAITDHSQAVRVAQGMDEDRLRKQAERVRKLDDTLDDIWILAGVEVDILKNGDLDLPEDALADLDWVVAAVHSHFGLSEQEMTQRLLAAIRSGAINCIAHPLTRVIGSRDAISFDVDEVFEACREHGVVLETNAQPDRLDLPDTYCQRARELGCKVSIGTDAHKVAGLDFMRFGVATARRGWLEQEDVINTLGAEELRQWLADRG